MRRRWQERNVAGLAGLHNQGERVLAVSQEVGGPAELETTEGALTTDTEIIWLVCGKPTRNTGRFRDASAGSAIGADPQIENRTARLTNKEQIASWVSDYGEDSEFVARQGSWRVPRAGSMQFVGSEVVEEASQARAGAAGPS